MPQIKKIYEVVAFFDNDDLNTEKLKNTISQGKINSVLLAIDIYSQKDLIKTIFSGLPLTLSYIDFNDLYEFITKKVSLEQLDEAWFLKKISKPENRLEQIVKRIFGIL